MVKLVLQTTAPELSMLRDVPLMNRFVANLIGWFEFVPMKNWDPPTKSWEETPADVIILELKPEPDVFVVDVKAFPFAAFTRTVRSFNRVTPAVLASISRLPLASRVCTPLVPPFNLRMVPFACTCGTCNPSTEWAKRRKDRI